MFGLIWNVIKGGGLLTATAAGGTAVAVGLDSTLNHGNITKDIFGNVMETITKSQADAGIETGVFSLFKWIDELMEMWVGANGRSPFTDFVRGGMQNMMGIVKEEQELGSTAKPSTLTNPRSEGYIGPNAIHPDPNAPAGTTQVVDANGTVVTGPGATADQDVVTIMKPQAFFNDLGQEITALGDTNGNGDYEEARDGLADAGKSAWMGLNTTTGWLAGGTVDLVNLAEEFTLGWFGVDLLPNSENGYREDAANYMKESFNRFADANLGGAPDIEHSALNQVFHTAGGFAAGTPVLKGVNLAANTLKTGVAFGAVETAAVKEVAFDEWKP